MLSLLVAVSLASASELLGPIHHLQGKHIGEGEALMWEIEYFGAEGHAVVDETGGHFYHDRCCGGVQTDNPRWIYPQPTWDTYPMYYTGTTMRYTLTLTNTGEASYTNLRVVVIQEYLNTDGDWGEWIGPDATKDWNLEELRAGQSVVWEGTLDIPPGAHGGLSRTHLQVQRATLDQRETGDVIIDDTKVVIWCPLQMKPLPETGPTN